MTFRFIAIALLTASFAAAVQSQPKELPTEQDTLVVGRSVVLRSVSGGVFLEVANGELVPAGEGTAIQPGQRLLVRKGASFVIGRTTFGPESHGDRWVLFR